MAAPTAVVPATAPTSRPTEVGPLRLIICGLDGHGLAVGQRQIGQLDSRAGRCLPRDRLSGFGHVSADSLAAFRDHDAVDNQRLREGGGESVARVVLVGRQPLVDAHRHKGAGLDGQMGRNGRAIILRRQCGAWLIAAGIGCAVRVALLVAAAHYCGCFCGGY